MPKNEQLRRAIEWLGRQGQHDREFVEFVARRFDLSPLDEQFLLDEFAEPREPAQKSQQHPDR